MRRKTKKILMQECGGAIAVEAIYTVVITIFVIIFTFDFGVLYHNRLVMVAAANEAASGAGATYNSPARDPFTGYVATDFFHDRKIYRYVGLDNQLKTQKKAQWYGSYLIYKDEISADHKTNFASSVHADCSYDIALGCYTVSVNIEREYKTFFLNPLYIFGIDPMYTCKATGTAVCYDPLYQLNMMQFANQLSSDVQGGFATTKLLGSAVGILEKLTKFF